MSKINNIIRSIILAGLGSAAFSFCILHVFPQSPQNAHWLYSICFHTAVAIVVGILVITDSSTKTIASNLMSISLGRLLASGIAFLAYSYNFPEFKKWFMVHFMIHYVLFTFFEIVFLLKIVKVKPSDK